MNETDEVQGKLLSAEKDDKVFFSVSVKVNLGNYQSAGVDAGFSSSLLPDESVEEAQKRIQEKVMTYFKSNFASLKADVIQTIH